MGPTISTTNQTPNQTHQVYNSYNSHSKNHKKETIFIIDWDDTLMCTYFISLKTHGLSEEESKIVYDLGKVVSIFLKECNKYGKVIIMTNSSEEWLKKTNEKYLKIKKNIFENIKIISTRDKYLKKNIDRRKWKELALDELLKRYGDIIQNIICASDSESDIEVFKNLSEKNEGINISTIKFKSKPSPLVMIKEIEFLKNMLNDVIGKNKNYYLIKEKEKNDNFNLPFSSILDYIFPN